MKALSIRQPWPWAILHAGKRVENRGWQHAPRLMEGRTFLIHAGKGMTIAEWEDARDFMGGTGTVWGGRPLPGRPDLVRGAIVGRARLVMATRGRTWPGDRWAVSGALHLLLSDVEIIDTPIPFKGALGFFEVPDEVLAGSTWRPAS
jgi:hypothetical protein